MFLWVISREAVGARIKKYRKREGLTQADLAEKIGERSDERTVFSVSSWEQGKSYPDPPTMLRLAELFKVSLQVLYTGTESPSAGLSDHEAGLIQAYRIADKQGQSDINALCLDIMVEAHQKIGGL